MFDFVRDNKKIMMLLLILLIIPSFVFFGIEGYSKMNEKGKPVAQVAGKTISQTEWDATHRQDVDRLRAQNPSIDAKLLDSPQSRHMVLERMVQERVLDAARDRLKLYISNERLAEQLLQDPVIASLRDTTGKLDVERYRQYAASMGMSPELLEQQLRVQIARQAVLTAVQGGTGVGTDLQVNAALNALLQQREIAVLRFAPADFIARVKVQDEQAQTFYQNNLARFQTPEMVDIEYVVLSAEALAQSVVVTEAELKAYYDQNASQWAGPEQRRARHILIAAPKSMAAPERDKSKAQAQAIRQELQQSPQRFAELAKKQSQDPGSAPSGGDLGYFERGAMTPPFESAVFSLNKGQISDVVETDFGFHIIELTDIKKSEPPAFAQKRSELEAMLRQQQSQRKFAEAAEVFSNEVYEQPDSYRALAEKYKLTIAKATQVQANLASNPRAVWNHAKVMEEVFSSDALGKKRNSAAIEVAPRVLLSARVLAHRPAQALPFDQVKAQIVAQLTQEKAAQMARDEGQASLKALQADAAKPVAWGPVVRVGRQATQGLSVKVIDAALLAQPDKLPTVVGVSLDELGYALVKVQRVLPRESSSLEQTAQDRQAFAQIWGNVQTQAFIESLKQQSKVKMLVDKPGLLIP
jgi:peptidyl-prolyl cis-trans isomerase D